MEEQVNSKLLAEKQERFEDKYNKTTIFLTKFIYSENFEILKKLGLINSFVEDPKITSIVKLGENQRFLYLLFNNKKLKLSEIKKIATDLAVVPIQVVFSYELVGDYSMIVIDFPEKHIYDFDCVVQGKYSKLSESYKSGFPDTVKVFNSKKVNIGKEWTMYHHIFNKTEWLKEFWMNKLGLMELDENLELWGSPNENDLVFNINKLKI